MVSLSACVNLPLYHKVQKFSSGTGSPGWLRKKGRKMVVLLPCVLVDAGQEQGDKRLLSGRQSVVVSLNSVQL